MHLRILPLLLILTLAAAGRVYAAAVAPPANATVGSSVDMCGPAFCITLTAASDAGSLAPSLVDITVPVPTALFTTTVGDSCFMVSPGTDTHTFVFCELAAWQGHSASAVVRLAPIIRGSEAWITPSAYVFDPATPTDLTIAPILVRATFVYLPVIRR